MIEHANPHAFPELVRAVVPSLGESQLAALGAFRDLLLERGAHTNLTAIRDRDGVERRLIVESLRLFDPLRELVRGAVGARVMDLGTGAGLPGMVLAIARPDLAFTLLDATSKKVQFLEDVVRTLNLDNVTPRHGRAEDVARDPLLRGSFDVLTARAVTSLSALVELGLPFLRVGGHMLLPKGLGIAEELAAGERACAIVGGETVRASILPDAGSSIDTTLVTIRKIAPTSGEFPRRPGLPSRNPLGMTPESRRNEVTQTGGRRHR